MGPGGLRNVASVVRRMCHTPIFLTLLENPPKAPIYVSGTDHGGLLDDLLSQESTALALS